MGGVYRQLSQTNWSAWSFYGGFAVMVSKVPISANLWCCRLCFEKCLFVQRTGAKMCLETPLRLQRV